MVSFSRFPTDHRIQGRFDGRLDDGSRVTLEVSQRNRHPSGRELVDITMAMKMGRTPQYYQKEPMVALFVERRQRIDIQIASNGLYSYGRLYERSLRTLCEKIAAGIPPRPRPQPSPEPAEEPEDDAASGFSP